MVVDNKVVENKVANNKVADKESSGQMVSRTRNNGRFFVEGENRTNIKKGQHGGPEQL